MELRTGKQTDELDYYHNIYFKTLLHKKYLKWVIGFFLISYILTYSMLI